MKKLIASLILATLFFNASTLAQTEKDEIRLLIAQAPVAEAAAKAEEMEIIVVWSWLMALAYTGHTNEAFAAAAKITKWMSNDEANSAIALGLAIAGKGDEAISLSHRITDPEFQGLFINILAKDGRFSDALTEARKLEDPTESDESFQLIARELAARGEAKQALEIAGAIKDKKSSKGALRDVMKRLLKAGKLSEAQSIAERIQSDDAGRSTLRSAIVDLVGDMAKDGDQENALAMVDLIENEAERSWPLSIIAESFIEIGKFDEALETARKIKDESQSQITLAKIAVAKEHRLASDRGDSIEAVDQTTVEGLLKAGKIDEAFVIGQNIKGENERSKAFTEAAEFLLRSGSYNQARLAADRCPSPLERLELYLKIFNEIAFKRNPQLRAQLKKYDIEY